VFEKLRRLRISGMAGGGDGTITATIESLIERAYDEAEEEGDRLT